MPTIRPTETSDLNQPLLAEHERSQIPTPHDTSYPSIDDRRQTLSSDTSVTIEASRYLPGQRTTGDQDEDNTDDTETLGMTGFQRPDRNEISAMVISGTVVVLLSIAAGLTTIFDWVI